MPTAIAIAFVVLVAASVVQSVSGAGFGLIAAPLLLVLAPELVPGPTLVFAAIATGAVAVRERSKVKWLWVWILLAGSLPGQLAGLAVVHVAPQEFVYFGVAVVVVVTTTVGLARNARDTRKSSETGWFGPSGTSLLGIGAASGVLNAAAAMPGPPLAVWLRHENGRILRGTQSAYFCLVSILGTVTWSATHGGLQQQVNWTHALLLFAIPTGFHIARPLSRTISGSVARRIGLCTALAGGIMLGAKTLV